MCIARKISGRVPKLIRLFYGYGAIRSVNYEYGSLFKKITDKSKSWQQMTRLLTWETVVVKVNDIFNY